ncbi:serine hydrolase domain-containing protein [Amycolatopsis sp. NPDC059027]|uniref:serine hydrolase domain-containing protein n=1 Tax=Amycolatopsis sp. NPDC059027 TaxID=3346709 RepID=UPI00366E1369
MSWRRGASRGIAVGLVMAVLGVATIGTASAARRKDDVDTAVTKLVTEGGFPGAVAYYREDGRVRRYAAGVADTATGEPAMAWQRFRIASNTKAFVATVVLQLAGEQRLSLDDSVERWLPGVVRGPGYEPSRITVRQLLNHTSGVHDPDQVSLLYPYFHGHRDFVYTPDEVIRRSLVTPPSFAPGAGVSYSNTGYLLLGRVIERVTGHDVVRELRQRLLLPLGLWHTSFPTTSPHLTGPHLHGYDLKGEDLTTFSPSYDWTAGAMVSTVDDLATFHRALLAGRLLRPAEQATLRQLVPNDEGGAYGAGIETFDLPCGTVWGNTGAGPGFYSVSMSSADGRRQVVLVVTVYDLAADAAHAPKVVPSSPLPALRTALCG